MTTQTMLEIDCATGEQVERPMTEAEIVNWEAMKAESLVIEAERKAAEEATLAAKESAQTKLAALGLTADEINAITK